MPYIVIDTAADPKLTMYTSRNQPPWLRRVICKLKDNSICRAVSCQVRSHVTWWLKGPHICVPEPWVFFKYIFFVLWCYFIRTATAAAAWVAIQMWPRFVSLVDFTAWHMTCYGVFYGCSGREDRQDAEGIPSFLYFWLCDVLLKDKCSYEYIAYLILLIISLILRFPLFYDFNIQAKVNKISIILL